MTKHSTRSAETLNFSAEAGLGNPIVTSTNVKESLSYLPYSSNSFRYNSTNRYPQLIQQLAIESPTNGAAIKLKSMMTYGKGFSLENLSVKLKEQLQNLNKKSQSIDDILRQISYDYVTFGGFALKIGWTQGGNIGSIERIPFANVRCGEPDEIGDINYYVVSNNWDGTLDTRFSRTYSLPVFNPKVFDKVSLNRGIPVLSEDQLGNAYQIVYFYPELENAASSGMHFYPVPDYASCLDSILTEIKLGVSMKSVLDNGMGNNTIVNYPFYSENPDEMLQEKHNFIRNFTDAKNNGSVIVNFAEDKDAFPEYINLPAMPDNTHKDMDSIVEKQILKGHGIVNPSLLGINNGAGFSSKSDEMESAFILFNRMKITSYQQDIEKTFNTLISYMGKSHSYKVDMQIIPFTLLDEVDITSDELPSTTVDSANVDTTSLNSN